MNLITYPCHSLIANFISPCLKESQENVDCFVSKFRTLWNFTIIDFYYKLYYKTEIDKYDCLR